MFAVNVACNVKASKKAVQDCAERLLEEISHGFNLSSISMTVDGSDSTPASGVDVNMWFATRRGDDYNPSEAAREAERLADKTRLITLGKASAVKVGFWDSSRTDTLDEYRF